VKTYARLAMQAGSLDRGEYVAIRAVQGYSRTEGKRVDATRGTARVGRKKAEPVVITLEQTSALKRRPDTPQGRRDALLMCLLVDHGLRAGEVSRLQVADLDLPAGELRFYRPKVDKNQTHWLTADALRATARRWTGCRRPRGWSSPAMPLRYVEAARVANSGVSV